MPIQKYLENNGYAVFGAQNDRQLQDLLENGESLLVICDAPFTDPNLIHSAIRMRNKPSSNYIFILAVADFSDNPELPRQLVEAGVDDCINKPVVQEELALKLHLAERIGSLENKFRKTRKSDDSHELNSLLIYLLPGIIHEINNPTGFVASNITTMTEYTETIFEQSSRCEKLTTFFETRNNISAREKEVIRGYKQFLADCDLPFIKTDMEALIEECREGMKRIQTLINDLGEIVLAETDADDAIMTEADLNTSLDTALNVIWNKLKYKTVVKKSYDQLPLLPCFPRKMAYAFLLVLAEISLVIEDSGELSINTLNKKDNLQVRIEMAGRNNWKKEMNVQTNPALAFAADIFDTHKGVFETQQETDNHIRFIITLPVSNTD